jgi:hypothetical protein
LSYTNKQKTEIMEFIEEYKGFRILRDLETGFFKVGLIGGDSTSLVFLKRLIDIKVKNK